jgi:hypothetical protein
MIWITRGETPPYYMVKIYCSACGTLIEPDDGYQSIFAELRKEWQCNPKEKILHCTAREIESR